MGGSNLLAVAMLTPMLHFSWANALDRQEPTFVFRSGVELVRINAVVQDRRGRLVQNLSRADFEVFDDGEVRAIEEFRQELGSVSIALLFDVSGSMEGRLVEARETANQILARLQLPEDEAAVFSFDTRLEELVPFSTGLRRLPATMSGMTPYGATSLYDAIAQTARRFTDQAQRGAVVVFTDGDDNASQLTPAEVSGIASSINVPVYIFGVVPSVDNPEARTAVASVRRTAAWEGLTNLAHWTGGRLFFVSTSAQRIAAARELVEELRHQYLIAFEASAEPGWHPLVVRTKDKTFSVRARSGYFAGQSSPYSH
jgi:Ca-activated chloride channel homolog